MGIVIVNGAIDMHIMQIGWSNSYRNRNFGFFWFFLVDKILIL